MPLVAAAVCPNPPVLVPRVAARAATELDELRAACDAAVDGLFAARPDRLLVISPGSDTTQVDMPFHVSFAPWGVPLRIGDAGPRLPLGLAIGVWLLHRRDARPDELHTVATGASPAACARLGARLAGADRVALLVLGDGSACHGERSPGYDDPRAGPYDDAVAAALGAADVDALLGLDPALSVELHAAGRPAWQVLAGAVRAGGGERQHQPGWRGELRYHAAPYGVAYFVATWTPGGSEATG